MPDWQFLVVRHFGGRHQRRHICAQIKEHVEQRGLSHVLPLVKYELGRQREYYLGVAVDADASASGIDGEEAARQVLAQAGVHAALNRQISPLIEAEQIGGLLRGTLECESFTVPIAYESGEEPISPPTYELLGSIDLGGLSTATVEADESNTYCRILGWCSAVGSGELGRLKQACGLLGISSEWGGAWSVLRRMVLLGHLEFDGGAALRWAVVPPSAATSASGDYLILVGQRTQALVNTLKEQHQMEERPQAGGPSRLVFPMDAGGACYRTDRRLTAAGCASRQLAEQLPTVNEWVDILPAWEERDFARFETEQYDPLEDEFRSIAPLGDSAPSGLYRFTYEDGRQRMVTVAYHDEARHRWVCGDYYGLRFLARCRCNLCRVAYRSDSLQLVIPLADRWPMPYERALVLAAGLLPQQLQLDSGPPALVYEGITTELAERITGLLGLEMEGDE
jgi:hypothetical protein